ncbi:MAG: metal ABC transporter permease [Polyangiaceae bacterium]
MGFALTACWMMSTGTARAAPQDQGGGAPAPPPAAQPTPAEMKEIEAAVGADAKASAATAPAPAPADPPTRSSSPISLNPNIAFIGDFALAVFSGDNLQGGGHDPTQNGFNLQALEMSVNADVDPYFRFDVNIVIGPDGLELEEAYATTLSLPASLQVRAGQFLTRFGRINQMHPHRWDFVDQPRSSARCSAATATATSGPRCPGSRRCRGSSSSVSRRPWPPARRRRAASTPMTTGVCTTMALLVREGSERWTSRESLLGAVYLVGSAGALLVGTRIQQEAHDIQSILFGTAVLVRSEDLTKLEIIGAVILVIQLALGRGLRFASFDRDGARIRGLPVRALDAALFSSIAIAVSVSTRVLGALPIFAFSILPAMAGILVAPSVRAAISWRRRSVPSPAGSATSPPSSTAGRWGRARRPWLRRSLPWPAASDSRSGRRSASARRRPRG